jgi:hypothetical protein
MSSSVPEAPVRRGVPKTSRGGVSVAGACSDKEVYEELTKRLAAMPNNPYTVSLAEVIDQMGKFRLARTPSRRSPGPPTTRRPSTGYRAANWPTPSWPGRSRRSSRPRGAPTAGRECAPPYAGPASVPAASGFARLMARGRVGERPPRTAQGVIRRKRWLLRQNYRYPMPVIDSRKA